MNLLFLDSEMRSRAMLIVLASALNIEVSFGRCFSNIFPLCTVPNPVIFSSLDPSVKMCKCLSYLSLTFSNSAGKISGWVLLLWNLRSVMFMFGVQRVLWLFRLFFFLIVICILDKKYYIVCRICWAWHKFDVILEGQFVTSNIFRCFVSLNV